MKVNKKIWKVEEEKRGVVVGVIDGGEAGRNLAKKLTEKNCLVYLVNGFNPALSNCNYIFQLGNYRHFRNLSNLAREKKINFLLVISQLKTNEELQLEKIFNEEKEKGLKGRLLRVGDVSRWQPNRLAETIFWAMLNREEDKGIIDLAKEKIATYKAKNRKEFNIYDLRIDFRQLIKIPRFFRYIAFLLVLLSPLFLIIFNFISIAYGFGNIEGSIKSGKWDKLPEQISEVKKAVEANSTMLYVAETVSGPFSGIFDKWQKINMLSRDGIDVGEKFIQARDIFQLKRADFFTGGGGIDKESIERASLLVSDISADLSKMQKELQDINLSFIRQTNINSKLTKTEQELNFIKSILPILKDASEGKQKYLILFQNDLELRPTGGFIGSYGVLDLKEGKIVNFSIHDVYEADGQLKAHVDPPAPIREIMNQPNWFLRDSNFDPDFSLAGQQAMWFLEKETDDKFDGVIGINLGLLRDMLTATGGVYLPDFNENITADNLYLKAVVSSQKDFFPGSTAKKDFLGSLYRTILFMLSEGNNVDWSKIVQVVEKGLDEKNIMFYFQNEDLQKKVASMGWGGRMADVSCRESNCFPDYIAVIEANLGVNKANLYIQKETILTKTIISDGNVDTTITIQYKNNSPEEVFPAGTYKNYLRIYIPRDSIVKNVSIDNGTIDKVDQKDYGKDKKEVGFLVAVPPIGKKEVKMEYLLPIKIFLTDKVYQFFYQQQPGAYTSPLALNFAFPKNWQIKGKNFQPVRGSNGYNYTTDTAVDRIFMFDLKGN